MHVPLSSSQIDQKFTIHSSVCGVCINIEKQLQEGSQQITLSVFIIDILAYN